MDNKDNDLNLVDEMDDVGKLEERIGTSELKIKINNFLFQYVSSNTTVGELEKMAVEIYDKILSTYNTSNRAEEAYLEAKKKYHKK